VPPHLSRFERRRIRRPGKSDPGDALAIARVTAREPNLPPIRLPDRTAEIRLLLEAREDLIGEATRVRNRLHAHLRILLPGYGGTVANLVAPQPQPMSSNRMPGLSLSLRQIRSSFASCAASSVVSEVSK
jgi:transposase